MRRTNAPHAPNVQIVGGEPTVVTHKRAKNFDPSPDQMLADNTVMMHMPGTHDTYKCVDCGIILSGYKTDTVDTEAHIWKGGALCRFIKTKFSLTKNLLIGLHGRVRFKHGCVALPQYILWANQGYVNVTGRMLCVICCSSQDGDHCYNCDAVTRRLVRHCTTLAADACSTDAPLFREARVDEFKPAINASKWTYDEFQADPANMEYMPGTADGHRCPSCKISVNNFVENDTLLGEHIYHVYNSGGACSYIEERFKGKQDNLRLILGYERYRRGMFAFPEAVANSRYGYVSINGRYRCIVCAASGEYETYYTADQHHRIMCATIKESVLAKLRLCPMGTDTPC